MDAKKISEIARHIASWFPNREHQRSIAKLAKRLGRWVGVIAIVSGIVSFAIEGKELYTKKLPQVVAFISKHVLLGGTLRPYLIERISEEYLGYTNVCLGSSQKLDFDGDGDATDLLFDLYRKDDENKCPTDGSYEEKIYVILKESGWTGIWPEYTLLRQLAVAQNRPWLIGTGYPMSFEEKGQFLLGKIYGTDFPGYEVYGYANGTLHLFGQFRPQGSMVEAEGSDPIMQIGNRLFLHSDKGMIAFEITSSGQFNERTMSAHEIVNRNNSVLMLEYFSELPKNAVLAGDEASSSDEHEYITNSDTDKSCLDYIFVNGDQMALKSSKSNGETHCSGEVKVTPTAVLVSNVYCDFQGFKKIHQFPWGYVFDTRQSRHTIKCPYDPGDDSDSSYGVEILVSETVH